ncbi:MAG: transporter substrate-binding domain-containing protein [Clostridia bacterium]
MKKKVLLSIVSILCVAVALFAVACSGQKGEVISLTKQTDIFIELNSGKADVGVMDSVMAGYYVKQADSMSKDLQIASGINLGDEKYGIGFRKGSAIVDKVNTELAKLAKDGTVKAIAETYGLTESLLDVDYTSKWDSIADKSDWETVKANGTIKMGYTVFAPIAFDKGGKLVGFDIELATKVFNNIGLKVEFVEINWDTKLIELKDKKIDCIWNGMTITDDLAKAIDFSTPYMANKQCAVVKKSNADKYKTIEDIKNVRIAVESGSAGEMVVQALLKK